MTTPPHPLITRPGGHSAKNAHRAGAPNTQPSGENPMVGTNPILKGLVHPWYAFIIS